MEIGKLLSSSRDRLIKRLKDVTYRHAWVQSHIKNGIAFQIRAMRKAAGWDQKKLAEMALGNSELQPMISRYENPDYGKYTMKTLLDLAKAFDVGLIVRFAPFSELVEWEEKVANTELALPSFEKDSMLAQGEATVRNMAKIGKVIQAITSKRSLTSGVADRPMVPNPSNYSYTCFSVYDNILKTSLASTDVSVGTGSIVLSIQQPAQIVETGRRIPPRSGPIPDMTDLLVGAGQAGPGTYRRSVKQ